jgi:hypothetical protein
MGLAATKRSRNRVGSGSRAPAAVGAAPACHIERHGTADKAQRTLYNRFVDGYARFLFGLLRFVAGTVLGVAFVALLLVGWVLVRSFVAA